MKISYLLLKNTFLTTDYFFRRMSERYTATCIWRPSREEVFSRKYEAQEFNKIARVAALSSETGRPRIFVLRKGAVENVFIGRGVNQRTSAGSGRSNTRSSTERASSTGAPLRPSTYERDKTKPPTPQRPSTRERKVSSSIKSQESIAAESVLKGAAGIASHFTLDNRTCHCEKSINLTQYDSTATPSTPTSSGTSISVPVSEGYHVWFMKVSNFDCFSVGILSMVGSVDSFKSVSRGDIPDNIAALKPGPRLRHAIYWRDESGLERSKSLLAKISSNSDKTVQVSVSLDFVNHQIGFYIEMCLVGCVYIHDLVGRHCLFVHLKYSSSVSMFRHKPCYYAPLQSETSSEDSFKYLIGNPYFRSVRLDGSSVDCSFVMPLGICVAENKQYQSEGMSAERVEENLIYVTDGPFIRVVDISQGSESIINNIQIEPSQLEEQVYGSEPPSVILGEIYQYSNSLIVVIVISHGCVITVDRHSWEVCVVSGFGCRYNKSLVDKLKLIQTYDTAFGCCGKPFGSIVPSIQHARSELSLFGFSPSALTSWGKYLLVVSSTQHCVFACCPTEVNSSPFVLAGEIDTPGKEVGWHTVARFNTPTDIVADPENVDFPPDDVGAPFTFYISDTGNNRICAMRICVDATGCFVGKISDITPEEKCLGTKTRCSSGLRVTPPVGPRYTNICRPPSSSQSSGILTESFIQEPTFLAAYRCGRQKWLLITESCSESIFKMDLAVAPSSASGTSEKDNIKMVPAVNDDSIWKYFVLYNLMRLSGDENISDMHSATLKIMATRESSSGGSCSDFSSEVICYAAQSDLTSLLKCSLQHFGPSVDIDVVTSILSQHSETLTSRVRIVLQKFLQEIQ